MIKHHLFQSLPLLLFFISFTSVPLSPSVIVVGRPGFILLCLGIARYAYIYDCIVIQVFLNMDESVQFFDVACMCWFRGHTSIVSSVETACLQQAWKNVSCLKCHLAWGEIFFFVQNRFRWEMLHQYDGEYFLARLTLVTVSMK